MAEGGEGRRSPLDFVRNVPRELKAIVREEIDDAKREVLRRTRDARLGLVLLGVAAALALATLTTLAVGTTIALADVLPWWAAILVVVGPLAIVTGILAALGAARLRSGAPPVPSDAIGDAKRRVRSTLSTRDAS